MGVARGVTPSPDEAFLITRRSCGLFGEAFSPPGNGAWTGKTGRELMGATTRYVPCVLGGLRDLFGFRLGFRV